MKTIPNYPIFSPTNGTEAYKCWPPEPEVPGSNPGGPAIAKATNPVPIAYKQLLHTEQQIEPSSHYWANIFVVVSTL